ncbi:MAG: PKD domain-containing protein, partial [Bacteroidota bacterium]
ATATITLNVTNKPGELNPTCDANPAKFTNSFNNITGNTANMGNGVTPQCLIVLATPPPVFTADTVCQGFATNFTDTTRVTAPLSISKWEWFFGDNSVSSAQNPTHTYANPGIYTVKMKLTFSNGVVDSISKQVKVNPLPQLTLGAAPTICRGDTASLTVTGTGTISWTPAASLSSSTVFNPRAFPAATTTYQIKVTDPTTLCFKDTSITVTVNPRPVPVITGDLTVCPGGLPTVLTATGGVSYRWLPGNETTASITVSPQTQTSYSVIATNANGCKDTATVTVTMVAPPSRFVAAVTNRSCGSVNGSITVTSVTGGKAPYQYSRNGGTFQTANTFTGLDTTNYLITVKDAKGCTYDSILRVGITSGPTATAFTTAGSGCGNPTGRITVNSSTGGKAPYQYSIDGSTYQAGNMFTSLGSGSYQLYVKDANGCIYDTSAVVGALSGPSDLAVSVTADSCNKHNGTVTITGVTGGNPPYQYSQDGTTYGAANSFGSLTGGAFTVYVRDAANCVFSKGGTVPTIIPVSAFQSFSTVDSCELGKGTISVRDEVDGRTPYQYSINGGTFQASNTFTGLAHGNYTLTVKDAGGCTVSQPDTVVPTAPIQGINPATTAATCSQSNGSVSITVTGGTGPFLLQLNNLAPDTITTYNGLSIRTHTVTVVDSNLCTATQTFAITDIPGPSAVSFTQTPTSCTTPTGTFTITGVTGGTMPYTYSVDHSPYTTDTAYTGLDSITHTLSVKDSNGCIKDSSVTIVTVNRPTALQYTLTHTTCSQSNGAIAITGVTGGTIPYTYAIDNSAFTTTTNYPGLTAKVYAIAVTDVNNCRFQITDTIKDSPSPDDLELSGTFTSCGRSLGSITIGNISKGTAPFLFSVNNSPFTATKVYPGLAGGNYRVEVRDVNGCMYFEMITIDDIAGPSNLYLDHADDTCGRNSGTLVITHVDGPARPFTFSKDGTIFQSDTVFTQVAALARYTVTVKDNNGCVITATDSVGIVKGPNLPTDFGTKDPHCDLADGSLFIRISSITEGTPPITLSIGGQPQPTNGETFTGLVENNYTVVITDANGCTNTRNFMLTDIPAPHDATTTIAGSTCSLPNGSLTITSVDGGTPPYTYSHLSSGFDTATVFNGLSSGTNQLFVIRDSAGCLLDVRRDIPGAPGPTEITAGIVDENCFRGDGALTGLKATGGTKPVTFLFQSSSTYAEGQSVNNLRNGNYTIEATDANGCQLTDTFTIENRPAPVADFSASQYSGEAPANISFYNESTGAANYAWSFGNGETSTLAEPAYYYSDSGTYQVQLYAANAAGCADSITKTIMLAPMVSLYIPNSFTPDGDGINDFFTVKSYCIESYQLDVWNRWGEKIITISQDSPGWDGTFMGEECKTDSYPYRIVAVDYLGHKHHHLGKVTLMR